MNDIIENEIKVTIEGDDINNNKTEANKNDPNYLKKLLAIAKRTIEEHKYRINEANQLSVQQDKVVADLKEKNDKGMNSIHQY